MLLLNSFCSQTLNWSCYFSVKKVMHLNCLEFSFSDCNLISSIVWSQSTFPDLFPTIFPHTVFPHPCVLHSVMFIKCLSQVALVVKNAPASARDISDVGSIPGSGRSTRGEHGNLLQYSCLENPMDRGAWRATVHGVAWSQTWLKWLSMQQHTYTGYYICLLTVESFFSPSSFVEI